MKVSPRSVLAHGVFAGGYSTALAATCGMKLDHGVFAAEQSRRPLGVLTATCDPKFDHGALAVGYGSVMLTCVLTASCGTQLCGVCLPRLAIHVYAADSLHYKYSRGCVSSELMQAGCFKGNVHKYRDGSGGADGRDSFRGVWQPRIRCIHRRTGTDSCVK